MGGGGVREDEMGGAGEEERKWEREGARRERGQTGLAATSGPVKGAEREAVPVPPEAAPSNPDFFFVLTHSQSSGTPSWPPCVWSV